MPVYTCLVKPSEAFMLADQTTSRSPATSNRAQAVAAVESVAMVAELPEVRMMIRGVVCAA